MEYQIVDKKGKPIKGITIQSSAVDDFKFLMGWTEQDWNLRTVVIHEEYCRCGERITRSMKLIGICSKCDRELCPYY